MSRKLLNLLLPVIKNQIVSSGQPYFCTYILTWRCNAKCKMCDIWKKGLSYEMNTDEVIRLFKQIPDIKVMRLTGGEPFLRDDLIDILHAVKKDTKIQIVHITTNGILTERILNFVKHMRYPNLHLKISLTAYGDRHDDIMGHKGAYQKAMATVDTLKSCQDKYKFYMAINQTITDLASYEDSKKIRAVCRKYKLSYLPVIAYKGADLYSAQIMAAAGKTDFDCWHEFSKSDLITIFNDFISEAGTINDIIEKIVKRYYLKGLYNRLVAGINKPNPRCVALRNHIRILPNGDVPVCLYNATVAGNLKNEDFKTVWNSSSADSLRRWVDGCKGCWAECETIPNAIFSGDIIARFWSCLK